MGPGGCARAAPAKVLAARPHAEGPGEGAERGGWAGGRRESRRVWEARTCRNGVREEGRGRRAMSREWRTGREERTRQGTKGGQGNLGGKERREASESAGIAREGESGGRGEGDRERERGREGAQQRGEK